MKNIDATTIHFNVSWRSVLEHIGISLFIYILVFIFISTGISKYVYSDDISVALMKVLFLLLFVLMILPLAVYYRLNHKDLLVYNRESDSYVFFHGKQKIEFTSKDISAIELFCSSALWLFYFCPWRFYSHTCFIFNNGNRIILSSLMFDEFALDDSGLTSIIKKHSFYRPIFGLKHKLCHESCRHPVATDANNKKPIKYKISLKTHLSLLISVLAFLLIPALMALINYLNNVDLDKLIWAFLVGLIIVSPIILMGIFVHINYYRVNKKDLLVLNENEIIFSSRDGKCISKFAYEDIEEIDVFMASFYSFSIIYISLATIPWEFYNHAVLKMKNGQELVVTSLLCPAEFWIMFLPSKRKVYNSIYRSGLGLRHKL